MITTTGITSPVRNLRGRARLYSSRYLTRFNNMLARARKQGWLIQRVPGPRGGEWSATYYAVRKETERKG